MRLVAGSDPCRNRSRRRSNESDRRGRRAVFAGKRLWIDRQIESAESAGTVGTLSLDYHVDLRGASCRGIDSVFRDQRITDSGAARFAGWLLSAAVREANDPRATRICGRTTRPRRAVQAARELGGAPVVEVVVSQETALRRSREHVALDAGSWHHGPERKTARRPWRSVARWSKAYYHERGVLGTLADGAGASDGSRPAE